MWWNTGPHLQRRMKAESGGDPAAVKRTSTTFFKNDSNTAEFLQVLKSKFGTVTRAWRMGLDADESGLLDFREFCQALKELGYSGNLRALWYNLDDDNSGNIGLKELDAVAAQAFEKFRYRCNSKYGSISNTWDQLLDRDHSGTVSYAEFWEAVQEVGYEKEEEAERLFALLLLRPGSRYLILPDITFLQNWEDAKQELQARKRLTTGWVNRDPYIHLGEAAVEGKETTATAKLLRASTGAFGLSSKTIQYPLDTEVTVPGAVPGAPSPPASNYSDLCCLDANVVKEDFKQFLKHRYGSLCHAFDTMDANNSGSLSMIEFQTIVTSVLEYCRTSEARRLFHTFVDETPGDTLTWQDLGITSQEWIQHSMQKRTRQKQREAADVANQRAPLGSSPRCINAKQGHHLRIQDSKPRGNLAFGMPLPRGWGFPPTYDPRHGSQSAR